MSDNKLLICIVGPTAIGKTALSIKIANYFSTEILSADSRQFYKEMTIGTAVPSEKELGIVKHHFIQNRSILDTYAVGDFEKDALFVLDSLFNTLPIVVMVGGSGLYVDAVVKGLNEFPEVTSKIRDKLNSEFKTFGIEFLQNELKEKDPDYFQKVEKQNHHRLIRALEVCRSTGLPYSSFIKLNKKPRKFETLYIGLIADREFVYKRINNRVENMIENGLENEAKELHQYKDLYALNTVGYKELFGYFDGDISKIEAIEEIKKNTRRFSKRQGTWFRKNKAINWFDYKTKASEIINFIENTNPNIIKNHNGNA